MSLKQLYAGFLKQKRSQEPQEEMPTSSEFYIGKFSD